MSVKPIPDGYHTVTSYLVAPDARGLIDFMKQAFGATERVAHTNPDGQIMHAEVQIGDSVVMVGGSGEMAQVFPGMLHLYVPDTDTMYRKALDAGADSQREPADQFYGDRSGGVKDRWGNQWWLATHIEDVSEEEMVRRMQAQPAPAG